MIQYVSNNLIEHERILSLSLGIKIWKIKPSRNFHCEDAVYLHFHISS